MRSNEDELEFVSIKPEDDNELNTYMDPSQPDESNSTIGNWILNQSKVF